MFLSKHLTQHRRNRINDIIPTIASIQGIVLESKSILRELSVIVCYEGDSPPFPLSRIDDSTALQRLHRFRLSGWNL